MSNATALTAMAVVVASAAVVYAVSVLLHIARTMNATVVEAKRITVDLDDVVAKLTAVLLRDDERDE